ncbi:UPF0755 protein [Desulfurobacterium pacificum]|uniref:Endolytic murein transglycosylase n=1 Tax=Desulfurobacterium pacificum TaxID=240166 RepID=A0ABY1NIB6_9BACT|nr:endolytic transglycosylase MltG [Desulfurobacterium pacificum]SMP10602.1 UPF0755 protein [Desulfurobacterium pacificum]
MKKLLPFLAVLLFISTFITYALRDFLFPKEVNVKLKIKKGESVKQVIERLKEQNVISHVLPVYIWVKLKKLKVKEGCYEFSGKLTAGEILEEFTKGHPCLVSFTIRPGDDLFSVDKTLSQTGICSKGEVLKLSKDKDFLKKLNIPFLEGYLFPDTYKVAQEANCRKALSVPVKEFKDRVYPLFEGYNPPPLVKKALKKVTLPKILIVASIIEKETSNEKEKPLIASVIYNRLTKGMKLQCDPTVFYAYKMAGIEKKRLHRGDVDFPSPYNTYYVRGLPPTPICNPSLSSIKAAMYPAKTQYLYFVAYGNKHLFSKSYNQHLKLIREIYRYGKAVRNR